MKEQSGLLEIVLAGPGMNTAVKLDKKVSRRLALFLVMAVEFSMSPAGTPNPLDKMMNQEDRDGFKNLIEEVLKRTELDEFYAKLRTLI